MTEYDAGTLLAHDGDLGNHGQSPVGRKTDVCVCVCVMED